MEKTLFAPYVKDNFFDSDEENLIWNGLDKIHELDLFLFPEDGGSAEVNGKILKKNLSYFITPNKIPDEDIEFLYKTLLKIFNGTTIEYSKLGLWEKLILNTTKHNILVSYYENGDKYLPHFDESIFTVLIWFYRTPKKFEGGDLFLHDTDEKIDVLNNRLVIIPSVATHSVSEVKMKSKNKSTMNNGRYCITLFLS